MRPVLWHTLWVALLLPSPQTYLGLPLSPHKLRPCDYQPLIAPFDKYLSGWKAWLLNSSGWIILVNVVLSNLPVAFFMSSNLLPKSIWDILDAHRRPFLWTGKDSSKGCQCLLAWICVSCSREHGGLSVKNLEDQNHCILMKLVHKFCDDSVLPWKTWYLSHTSQELGSHSDNSFLDRIVHRELPTLIVLVMMTNTICCF
jgi:hypothetical protein